MAWKDATKSLGGKSAPKKGKKEVKEIRTRKGKTGGYIHEHHFADGSEPEEHTSPDQDAMVQHMIQNMGDGSAAPQAAPDPNAAQAGPPQATPAGPPAPPGAM